MMTIWLLPLKNIERMSYPAVWWEVTPAKLYRAASLRTAMATSDSSDTPLTWYRSAFLIDLI